MCVPVLCRLAVLQLTMQDWCPLVNVEGSVVHLDHNFQLVRCDSRYNITEMKPNVSIQVQLNNIDGWLYRIPSKLCASVQDMWSVPNNWSYWTVCDLRFGQKFQRLLIIQWKVCMVLLFVVRIYCYFKQGVRVYNGIQSLLINLKQ